MVGDGILAGTGRVIDDAAKTMLKDAPKVGRFVLKKIPGAPGLVLDAVELVQAKDKGRKIASMAGGILGGAAGGALGAATGPGAVVAAPLGAAVGSVAGQHIAEDVYDDNVGKIAAASAWIKARNDAIARNLLNEVEHYTRPPQFRHHY